MLRKLTIMGYVNKGFEGQGIGIECDIRNGFPGFDIVGLPDSAIKESKERVKTALRNSGFKFPQNRVLISLFPASQPKSGSLLDLGIALAMLFALNKTDKTVHSEDQNIKIMVAGELMLNGDIVQTADSLGAIECAKNNGCSICLIPYKLGSQDNKNIIQVSNLVQAFLACGELLNSKEELPSFSKPNKTNSIFTDVIGLSEEKEILSMAASGFHSILLFGPPGVGKTMLSNKICHLIPSLTEKETEEVKRIYSCCRNIEETNIPPSRLLSHDLSALMFNSGKTNKAPGEGSLAHRGVLILDEATKYSPKLLQAIQTSYDCGYIQNSKGGELLTYPSKFLMVANLNPCPCGSLGNSSQVCTCTAQKIENHWKKLGWQFIDRFDIRLPIKIQESFQATENKPDSYYLDRIQISSERQKIRYRDIEGVSFNGEIHYNTQALACLKKETELYMKINEKQNQSTRTVFCTIALARTIADYQDRDIVLEEDINKAIALRSYCHGDYYWRQLY